MEQQKPTENKLHQQETERSIQLRSELMALIATDEDAYSARKLGKMLGLSGTAVNTWLNRRYAGTWETVNAKVEEFLASRREQETLQAERKTLPVPERERFAVTAQTLIFRVVTQALKYAQMKGEICVIEAPWGSGKTRSIKEYKKDRSTVILVEVCETSTTKDIIDEVAGKVGGVELSGTIDKKTRAIADRVRGRQMVLVFDEAEFLKSKTIGAIRRIYDLCDGEVGILLVGAPPLAMNLHANRRQFGYINSRVGSTHEVNRSPKQEIDDYAAILTMFLGVVPPGLPETLRKYFGGDIRKAEKQCFKMLLRSRRDQVTISADLLEAMAKESKMQEVA